MSECPRCRVRAYPSYGTQRYGYSARTLATEAWHECNHGLDPAHGAIFATLISTGQKFKKKSKSHKVAIKIFLGMAASAIAAIRSTSSRRRNLKDSLSEEMSLVVDKVPPEKELEGNFNIEVLLNG